jgi:hypothetical protein
MTQALVGPLKMWFSPDRNTGYEREPRQCLPLIIVSGTGLGTRIGLLPLDRYNEWERKRCTLNQGERSDSRGKSKAIRFPIVVCF